MKKNKIFFLFLFFVIVQFGIGIYCFTKFRNILFGYFFITSIIILLLFPIFYISVQKKFNYELSLQNWQIQKTNFVISEKNKIGIIIYDKNQRISWINEYFKVLTNKNYIGKKITNSIITKLDHNKLKNGKTLILKKNFGDFSVYKIKDGNVLVFTDICELTNFKKWKRESQLVFGIINFSNYNEILNILGTEERNIFFEEIFQFLNNWCFDNNILIINLNLNQQFLLILNWQNLDYLIKKTKFKILLEKIVELLKKNQFSSLISVGISYGADNPKILHDSAVRALKTAINRGGNQIVIFDYNKQKNTYIGDFIEYKNVSFDNNNLNLFVAQFRNIIPKYKNIFITTHIFPDYDGIGAALGMYFFCKRNCSNVKIVIDFEKSEDDIFESIKNNIPKNELEKMFIPNLKKNVKQINTEDSLLIVVDTSFRDRVEDEIINKFKKIIVIDHHRSSEKFIDNIFLYFISTYVSSSSEIVSEILLNRNNDFFIDIPQYVLNFLLLGIVLDTNYFRERIYSRTFFVINELKKLGADFSFVSQILKDDFEIFKEENNFLNKLKKINNDIFVILGDENKAYKRSFLAKAAQKAITIKKINTCFIITKDKNMHTILSCRSNDKNMNLQRITEQLDGGGHFTSAGAQSKKLKISEMYKKLLKILKNEGKN